MVFTLALATWKVTDNDAADESVADLAVTKTVWSPGRSSNVFKS